MHRKAATQIQKFLRGYIVKKHTSILYERSKLARLLEENDEHFGKQRLDLLISLQITLSRKWR
jgi:hypothetical protein